MTFDLDRLARLWNDPPPEDDADAYRAFAEVYADPVVLNGEPVAVRDLVAMARQSHLTYQDQDQDRVILDSSTTATRWRSRSNCAHSRAASQWSPGSSTSSP